jgi:hypothetical protein
MSELIKREDVRREIQASFDGGAFRWQDGQDLMDRINALPAASPWHRVEEELPKSGEFGEIVLACNDVGTVNAAYLSGNGKLYAANNTMYDAWTWMPNVTHWMPMPEPPKEDVDANK